MSTQLMINNRKLIIGCFRETGSITKTHEKALKEIPDLKLSLSQFKPYCKMMIELSEAEQKEFEKVRYELDKVICELDMKNSEIEILKNELNNFRMLENEAQPQQNSDRLDIPDSVESLKKDIESLRLEIREIREIGKNAESHGDIPEKVDGWSVSRQGKFYKVNKRIKNKLYWIHIGEVWDTKKAKNKIWDKLKEITAEETCLPVISGDPSPCVHSA